MKSKNCDKHHANMSIREQRQCAEKNTYENKNKGSVYLYDRKHYEKIVTNKNKGGKLF